MSRIANVSANQHQAMGKCDLPEPYPEIRVLAPNPFYARLLLDDYASNNSELNAINQYLYHHFRFEHMGLDQLADLIRCISLTEMYHLEILAELILKLGGDPRYQGFQNNNNQYYSGTYVYYGNEVLEMLAADIDGEKGAIIQYRRHISQISDPYIKQILARIIKAEEHHLKLFSQAYEKHQEIYRI